MAQRHITKAKCHFFKNNDFSQVLTSLPKEGAAPAKTKSELPWRAGLPVGGSRPASSF